MARVSWLQPTEQCVKGDPPDCFLAMLCAMMLCTLARRKGWSDDVMPWFSHSSFGAPDTTHNTDIDPDTTHNTDIDTDATHNTDIDTDTTHNTDIDTRYPNTDIDTRHPNTDNDPDTRHQH